ncbi:MAG: tetratricopeptide repeat protein [Polyangiales bacterium]|jgi:tetratricopeptide (TPR) repeat protein
MKRLVTVACLILGVSIGAAGQEGGSSSLTEVFEGANVAASRGDHASAVSGYGMLVDAGVRDPDVFYNLGTAFAQSGDYPRAILNYERALELRPNDDATEENLRMAERRLEEGRAEAEGEATIQRRSSIGDAIFGSLTEDALAYALLLANLCFFVCLAWAWTSRAWSGGLIAAFVAAGLILAFSALGIGVKAGTFRDGPRAIALDDRVVLLEGPDEQAQMRGEARGGDRCEVIGADRDFVKLRVVSGLEGWVPAAAVGLVDLDEGLH